MAVLSDEERARRMSGLPGWEDGGDEIRKRYTFGSFAEAIEFVGRVAELATRRDHHPDILIQYKKVTLLLSTHSEGGVTERDLEFAEALESSLR